MVKIRKVQPGDPSPSILTRIGELDQDDLGKAVEVQGDGYTVRGTLSRIDTNAHEHAYRGVDEHWDAMRPPNILDILCGRGKVTLLGLPTMGTIRIFQEDVAPVLYAETDLAPGHGYPTESVLTDAPGGTP